jgi:hypothetical protein
VPPFLERIRQLVSAGQVVVSLHGAEQLEADDITARDALAGVSAAVVVEEYPEYLKGPCILVLQHDSARRPIHVLWGIAAGTQSPAVLVTAYRPDSARWDETWLKRRTS